jgi:hypothetical protein
VQFPVEHISSQFIATILGRTPSLCIGGTIMDRRTFLKLAALFSLIAILPKSNLRNIFRNVTQHERAGEILRKPRGASSSTAWDYAGQIDFRQIDEKTLGEWWAILCGMEMPKEFNNVPRSMNERDYIRGAFQIVNAICPRDAAMDAWQRNMGRICPEEI